MSKMLPQRSVDTFRQQVNVTLDMFGITCTLYIPTNLSTTEAYDIYQTPSDYEFNTYTTTCFIDWNPNMFRLKAKGLYVEDELPIIVYIPYEATDVSGNTVEVDVLRHSYITIEPQFIPDDHIGCEEYELVDIIVEKFHDAAVVKAFKAVPRRYEETSG